MPVTHRTIVEERRIVRERQHLQPAPHDVDELIDAVKWTLAREPRAGVQVAPRNPVWFLAVDVPGGRPFGVFYTFDDNHVFLLSVRQSPP